MTPYELLEVINEIHNDEETIQILNEFIGILDNDPRKYINKLSDEIEQFAENLNICSLCGSKLKVISYEESRGEYQGFECSETIYQSECSNPECTYVK